MRIILLIPNHLEVVLSLLKHLVGKTLEYFFYTRSFILGHFDF